MKRLLIIKVPDLYGGRYDRTSIGLTIPTRATCEAGMVILQTPTHFRCIKNRWAETPDDEKIPNFMLSDYLMQYKDELTLKDLIDAL